MKIQARLMLVIIPVLFVVIGGAVSITTSLISTTTVEGRAKENVNLLSVSYSSQLNSTIMRYLDICQDLGSAAITAIHIETSLHAFRNRYPQFSNIFYTPISGQVLDMAPYIQQFRDFDFSEYDAWQTAFETMAPTISKPDEYFGQKSILFFAPALFSYVSNQEPTVEGIVVLVLPLESLFEEFRKISITDTGSIFIVDESGIFLHHKKEEYILTENLNVLSETQSLNNISKAMTEQKTGFATYTDDDERKFISFSPIPIAQWSLGVNAAYNQISSEIRGVIYTNLLAILFGIILGSVVLYFVVHSVVSPIEKLTKMVQLVQKGDTTITSGINANSEIGILSSAIDSMVLELRENQDNLEVLIQQKTEELRQSLRQVESMLTNLPVIFWVVDIKGIFLLSRGQGLKALGLKQDQVIGMSVFEMYKDNPEVSENIKKALNGEDVRYTSKIGELQFETLLMTDKDENGVVNKVNALSIDVSEQIKSEKELKKARDIAESANRAKSEFLSNMSHEIRTPLNAVIGFSELLSSMVNNDKERSYLSAINTAGNSLLLLINDILDLSKVEAGKIELQFSPTSIRKIIEDIKGMFSISLNKKNLQFLLNIQNDFPTTIIIDESRLRQIMLNLIGNATKFTERGHIKVSVNAIRNDVKKESIDMEIHIEDTGIGIDEKNLESIFESFNQQKGQSQKQFGGTGLGLTICKKLVELMNGHISAKSTKGEGSTFSIVLKDIEVSTLDSGSFELKAQINQYRFQKGNILVVDDIESNRLLLSELLPKMNLNVITKNNGREALDSIRDSNPDVVLMDIKMPVMDGFEAIKILKGNENTIQIPTIAISASSYTMAKEQIINKGFDGFLSKPVKIEKLYKELARFLPVETIAEGNHHIVPEDQLETLPEKVKASLPAVLKILNSEYSIRWEEFHEKQPIQDVKQFGTDLYNLGENYELNFITQYAKKITDSLDHFDIRKLKDTLLKFPDMIERLESLLKRGM